MLLATRLGAAGLPEIDLKAPPAADAYIDAFFAKEGITGPVIAVNPFCSKGSAFKRWEMDKYAGLIRRVGDATGATMMVLWGPGEEEEAAGLVRDAGGRAMLACPTTVAQAPRPFEAHGPLRGWRYGRDAPGCICPRAHRRHIRADGPPRKRTCRQRPYDSAEGSAMQSVQGQGAAKDRVCLRSITVEEVSDAVLEAHARKRER